MQAQSGKKSSAANDLYIFEEINREKINEEVGPAISSQLAEPFFIDKPSLRIISQLTLIPFHGVSQSKITQTLFSANFAFSIMALYLKTKTRIL